MSNAPPKSDLPEVSPLVSWLILGTAALGFAFDIYELLMWPLVGPPAIAHFHGIKLGAPGSTDIVAYWMGISLYIPAICGGIFGLLGGWLTDRFGRRAVLTYSILLYAGATFLGGFSTSLWMLIICRCFAFVGICVEFVAAVAWLAELYTDPHERERAIGFTQAFSSIGGLLVTLMYALILQLVDYFPNNLVKEDAWRYLLMSGLIPAIPLILVRPFLPESPVWEKKSIEGTLKRPDIMELFSPELLRTTLLTTLMFACSYGIAFGAIQQVTQIVPSHPDVVEAIQGKSPPDQSKIKQTHVKDVQLWQEIGGLVGRVALALIVLRLASDPPVLRMFLLPGMIVVPATFYYCMGSTLSAFQWAMFATGFFTVAQFSFWGNYLPRVYPIHLRGTGESFAANVGGRMIGTMAGLVTTQLALRIPGDNRAEILAWCAAGVALTCSLVGFVASFWLPTPPPEAKD